MSVVSRNFELFLGGAVGWNQWVQEQLDTFRELQTRPDSDDKSAALSQIMDELAVVAVDYVFVTPLNCAEYLLPGGMTLVDCTFLEDVDLSGAQCERLKVMFCKFFENLLAKSARFNKAALFEYCTVSGETDFADAEFSALLSISHTTFEKMLSLERCTFRSIEAHGVSLGHGATFRESQFMNGILCHDITFANKDDDGVGTEVDFGACVFHESAHFSRSKFDSVSFAEAEFHDLASFGSVTFREAVDFDGCRMLDATGFEGSTFHQTASFRAITVSEAAWFARTEFKGQVDFTGASFGDDLDLAECKFDIAPELAGCTVKGNVFSSTTNNMFETVEVAGHNVLVRQVKTER